MLITCQTHGETEAYEDRSDCKLCAREYIAAHRAKNKRKREQERQFTPVATHASWLTCNRPECGKVCTDRHDLYVHKTQMHGDGAAGGPDERSLLPSQLGQV